MYHTIISKYTTVMRIAFLIQNAERTFRLCIQVRRWLYSKQMTNLRIPLQRRSGAIADRDSESIAGETSSISARDSSLGRLKYAHQGPPRPRERPQRQASAEHSMRMSIDLLAPGGSSLRLAGCDEPPTKHWHKLKSRGGWAESRRVAEPRLATRPLG